MNNKLGVTGYETTLTSVGVLPKHFPGGAVKRTETSQNIIFPCQDLNV